MSIMENRPGRRLDRKDYIVLLTLGIVFAAAVIGFTHFEFAFGAKLDWSDQHFAIPDYFRKLFYQTGDLFPSLAPHIGGGENIYYLSYYGLFSPVILLSYFFPFVSMAVYIQVSSAVMCFLGVALFYRFMRRYHGLKRSLLLTVAYLTATPIFFQAHRHIMFVNYMPFLILALEAVDDYFEGRRQWTLVLWPLMIILTNWFFSVSALVAITLYGIYRFLAQTERFTVKFFWQAAWRFALRIITAVMCSGVLLLPTLFVLLNGRDKSNSGISLTDLLPNISTEAMGYSPYSMGLGAFAILAVICAVMSGRDKARRFMGLVFAAVSCLPAMAYILNGTMYIEAKVYIPFIPLALILCGQLLADLDEKRLPWKCLVVYIAVIALSTLFGVIHADGSYSFLAKLGMLIDSVVLITGAACYYFKGHRLPFAMALIAMPVVLFVPMNLVDKLVPLEDLDKWTAPEFSALSRTAYEKDNLWRTALAERRADVVNIIPDTSFYSSYIYSSLHHKGYNDFYFNAMHNENEFRNSALTTRSQNPFFAAFMGERYLISEKAELPKGYKQLATSGGCYLYENETALPIGRGQPALGEDIFDSLGSAEQMEALDKYIITGKGGSYESSVTDCGCIDLPANSAISRTETGYRVISDKKLTLTVPLEIEIPDDKLLVLEMTCDNTVGDREDARVTINGIRNTLTAPDWKYYNNNTTFTYVLTPCSELKYVFTAGDYLLSELHAYLVDKPSSDVDSFIINKELTAGDSICGQITCRQDEYFILTLPYDKGYTAEVDGAEQPLECVSKTFIGFPITAGQHTVELHFKAPWLKAGMAMSIAGLVSLMLLALLRKAGKNV